MGNQISFPYEQPQYYSAHGICRMTIKCQVQFSSMRENGITVMQHTSEIFRDTVEEGWWMYFSVCSSFQDGHRQIYTWIYNH